MIMNPWMALAAVSLIAWLYLVLARGRFWRADQRLAQSQVSADPPLIAVVIPARNESTTIGGGAWKGRYYGRTTRADP